MALTLQRPHRGPVTQRYGNIQPDGLPHAGQDYGYSDANGTYPQVYAAADGVVLFAGDSRALGWPNEFYINPDFNRNDDVDQSAGNLVVIGHRENGAVIAVTGYGHLDSWSVRAGQSVRASQQIAITGDTGYSFGKHLHFFLMFKPYNYNTPTYGCSDPNPYFGGSINPAGTITSEEDDMPYTREELKAIAQEGALAALDFKVDNTLGGKTSTLDVARIFDQSRLDTIALTAEATARLILNTAITRGGGSVGGETSLAGVVAYFDQNRADILGAVGQTADGIIPGLDPEQVNAAIKTGLENALAGTSATITLGGK